MAEDIYQQYLSSTIRSPPKPIGDDRPDPTLSPIREHTKAEIPRIKCREDTLQAPDRTASYEQSILQGQLGEHYLVNLRSHVTQPSARRQTSS